MKYFFLILFSLTGLCVQAQVADRPNIILISADDLNDYIEPLNAHPDVETPNINTIASLGTTFYNAYCPSPLCGPSRTSFLTGKDVAYTQVYTNSHYKCNDFSENFKPGFDNEEYFTLPGYLKDQGGYFTYGINKIFHCHYNNLEYDTTSTVAACDKSLSWNMHFVYSDTSIIAPIESEENEGVAGYSFGRLPDSLEKYMADYVATDNAIAFIEEVAADSNYACDRPFFLALGLAKPHKEQFIPEKYFSPHYNIDFYANPYDYPYNYPKNSYPQNGIIMPPQPEIPNSDYYALPENGMGWAMTKSVDDNFDKWADDFDPIPEIDPSFDDSTRLSILAWSERANAVMAYLAAVKYIDAQVGRFYEELISHPEIYNNTVLIFIGDHGYGLGEKMHWGKYAMWETDVRTSLIIADLRTPEPQVTHRVVNLLDLFPTICELTGIPYPQFSDSTDYLDGHSLMPLIEEPASAWERPVLSTVKKLDDEEGFCFPQFSVRNEKFHYIRYQSNGGGDSVCDEAGSYIEEELYELGEMREVDPYEWNNLINDESYSDVIDYLTQWLPDSSLYLQKTYQAKIENEPVDCMLNYDDTLYLHSAIFDTSGIAVDPPAGFIYRWSNNLNEIVFEGAEVIIPVSFIDESLFDVSSRIMFTFEMVDSGGTVLALDTKYFYLNDANTPIVSFTALLTGVQTISVTDVSISGTYNSIWWDFGEGVLIYAETPGPYTYVNPGDYVITCYVQYGNSEECVIAFEKQVTTINDAQTLDNSLFIYPNPAGAVINLVSTQGNLFGDFHLFNMLGELTGTFTNNQPELTNFKIDIGFLHPGLYVVRHGSQTASFIVL